MPKSPQPPPIERLLHCTADRILLTSTDPGTGEEVLIKLFARGSLADAQRECTSGQRLGHLNVVRYLGAGLDPATGRPCVRMELHPGRDLGNLVAQRGALPPALACDLVAEAVRTIAGMHAFRAPDLPYGIAHGDIRPANLLCHDRSARLLDLEHALPLDAAMAGATADVTSLGKALRFALTGDIHERGDLAAQDPELIALLTACSAPGAKPVPAAATLAANLTALAARLRREPAETVLESIRSGDIEDAERRLPALPPGPRRDSLKALLGKRLRLLRRHPGLLATPRPGATTDEVLRTLRTTAAVLRRFPAHADTLAARAQAVAAAGEVLARIPERIATLRRDAVYQVALDRIAATEQMARATLEVPGSFLLPGNKDPRLPSPLQRQPLQVLRDLRAEVETAEREHKAVLAELAKAERRLDLPGAEAIVDRIAAQRGGTTSVVAHCRDRLHRLAFYLERFSRSRQNLERLGDMLATAGHPADLQETLRFLRDCGRQRRAASAAGEVHAGMGLRSLNRALQDLLAEFRPLEARAAPAQRALEAALFAATDHAWQLLADAQEKLGVEPVPVRPLQTTLHRLDALRMIEALVDRPQRTRSQVLDRIESLRMKIDQARSARDQLARGAELAMARGHWTTGLFDMERAVDRIAAEGDDDEAKEAKRLQDRLAEVRRRKQDIETAFRRNMELASLYAELVDDPQSSFEQRLQMLSERRDLLQFLVPHVHVERGELYGRDLRSVEAQLAQEQAAQAEERFDSTEDPQQRLHIARETLAMLSGPAVNAPQGAEASGRILRLLEHWRKLAENAQRELERLHQEAQHRARRRRRRNLMGAAAIAVLGVVATFATGAFAKGDPLGSQSAALARRLGPPRGAEDIAANEVDAVVELTEAVRALEPPLAVAAGRTVSVVQRALGLGADPDLAAWQRDLHLELAAFGTTLADSSKDAAVDSIEPFHRFAARAWFTGLCLATRRSTADRDAIIARAEGAAADLGLRGIALPEGWRDELQKLR